MRVFGAAVVLSALFGGSYLASGAFQPFRCEGECVNGLNQSLSYLPGNLCGGPVLSGSAGDMFFLEVGMQLQVRSLEAPSAYTWRIDPTDEAGVAMFANAFLRASRPKVPGACVRNVTFDEKPAEVLEHGCVDELLGSLKLPVERPVAPRGRCIPADWRAALEPLSSSKSHPLQGVLHGTAVPAWGGLLQPVRALIPVRVRDEERFVPPWMSVKQLEAELGREVVRIERRAANVGLVRRNGPGAALECVEYEARHERVVAPGGERTPCAERFGEGDLVFLDFRPGATGTLAIAAELKGFLLLAPGDVVVEREGR